jgi:hypothetical protein
MLCVPGSMPAGSARSSAAALAPAGAARQTAVCTCDGCVARDGADSRDQADMWEDVSAAADVRSAADTHVKLTGLNYAGNQQR